MSLYCLCKYVKWFRPDNKTLDEAEVILKLLFMSRKSTVFVFVFTIIWTCSSLSHSSEKNNVSISHAVIQKPFAGAKSAAGYMIIENNGEKEVFLRDVSMPLVRTMIHETVIDDNGIVKMKHLMKLGIPKKETVVFKPGGFHIMLMGLEQTLSIGSAIPAKITFTNNFGDDFIIHILFNIYSTYSVIFYQFIAAN